MGICLVAAAALCESPHEFVSVVDIFLTNYWTLPIESIKANTENNQKQTTKFTWKNPSRVKGKKNHGARKIISTLIRR